MKITLKEIKIKDIFDGYTDNGDEGIKGYHGFLNIRPSYQREWIYGEKERNAVIETISKGFPLNVMYWAKNLDGTYEIIDGQQRTLSFCKYLNNEFSINDRAFFNLTQPEKERILDYVCLIYLCEGNEKEKLDWFRVINIAGLKLNNQELRNATYHGPWLSDAKKYFSKSNCPAYNLAKNYVSGEANRQLILETALNWISSGQIESYMSKHQLDQNANELWLYFKSVIDWVQSTFPKVRKEMKTVNWGELFNEFGKKYIDINQVSNEIDRLMLDDDVTKKSGIYPYVLTRNEKFLNIRTFTESQKREAYERQKGFCPLCKVKNKPTANKQWDIDEMEADHIKPWHLGGKTTADNCQMLCRECNREKGGM